MEGQNGYFSLKKGWFVFLTFVFMNHTVQLSQTRVCPSPQYRPINFSSLQFILEWNILFLFFLFFVSRLAVSTISFQEFAQTSQSSFSAVFDNLLMFAREWKADWINRTNYSTICDLNKNVMTITSLEPFLKSLMVGKLWILVCSNSLRVESILAITTESSFLNFSPSSS